MNSFQIAIPFSAITVENDNKWLAHNLVRARAAEIIIERMMNDPCSVSYAIRTLRKIVH